MNREQAQDLLPAFVFDELDASVRDELRAYLKTDAVLAQELKEMRATAVLLQDGVGTGQDEQGADQGMRLDDAHRSALARQIERDHWGRRVRMTLRPARLLAAAAVLVMVASLVALFLPQERAPMQGVLALDDEALWGEGRPQGGRENKNEFSYETDFRDIKIQSERVDRLRRDRLWQFEEQHKASLGAAFEPVPEAAGFDTTLSSPQGQVVDPVDLSPGPEAADWRGTITRNGNSLDFETSSVFEPTKYGVGTERWDSVFDVESLGMSGGGGGGGSGGGSVSEGYESDQLAESRKAVAQDSFSEAAEARELGDVDWADTQVAQEGGSDSDEHVDAGLELRYSKIIDNARIIDGSDRDALIALFREEFVRSELAKRNDLESRPESFGGKPQSLAREMELGRAADDNAHEAKQLIRQARDLQKQMKYDEAMASLDRALLIEPENFTAELLKEMIEDSQIMVKNDKLRREKRLNVARLQSSNQEAQIPYQDLLVYPNDWPELSERRLLGGDPLGGESQVNRETALKLRKTVPVDFEGNTLASVVDYLRETTGANIFVNWPALLQVGVEEDLLVTLELGDVPAEKALGLVLEQATAVAGDLDPVDYSLIDGVATISTQRDLRRSKELRVYDVRDLLTQVPNFVDGPSFDLTDALANANGGEGVLRVDQETGQLVFFSFDDLIQEESQGAERENQLEATVRMLNGHLVVKATSENHQEIQARLSKLKEEVGSEAEPEVASIPSEPAQPKTSPPPPVVINPWVMTEEDARSTFALDVDTASYRIARRSIRDGHLPPRHMVRVEEFVNAFDYQYPAGRQDTQAFAVHAEAGPSPFGKDVTLLKVGVRGKVIGRDQAMPAHLVFVIDTSGSMGRADRLPLVQHSLGLLMDQLGPQDRVTVVAYGTRATLLVENESADAKAQVLEAVGQLQTGGSTNVLAGLELGYAMAERHFQGGRDGLRGGVNRVVLCSDGVANVGATESQTLLEAVKRFRGQGVTFTSVGVGVGDYDDRLMETLANRGDGSYLFVGDEADAQQVFAKDMAATRPVIAKDAKVQVVFDPQRVRRYRLLGYENRAVADADFRNDAVDAGEVGSGQSATALYEVELIESQAPGGGGDGVCGSGDGLCAV